MQASQRRAAQPGQAGAVDATSVQELLAVAFAEPMRVAPSAAAILEWFERAIADERRRRERVDHGADYTPADAPITRILLERKGQVDTSTSWIRSAGQRAPSLSIIDVDPDEGLQQTAG